MGSGPVYFIGAIGLFGGIGSCAIFFLVLLLSCGTVHLLGRKAHATTACHLGLRLAKGLGIRSGTNRRHGRGGERLHLGDGRGCAFLGWMRASPLHGLLLLAHVVRDLLLVGFHLLLVGFHALHMLVEQSLYFVMVLFAFVLLLLLGCLHG